MSFYDGTQIASMLDALALEDIIALLGDQEKSVSEGTSEKTERRTDVIHVKRIVREIDTTHRSDINEIDILLHEYVTKDAFPPFLRSRGQELTHSEKTVMQGIKVVDRRPLVCDDSDSSKQIENRPAIRLLVKLHSNVPTFPLDYFVPPSLDNAFLVRGDCKYAQLLRGYIFGVSAQYMKSEFCPAVLQGFGKWIKLAGRDAFSKHGAECALERPHLYLLTLSDCSQADPVLNCDVRSYKPHFGIVNMKTSTITCRYP
ncbi:hypothetical protein F5146DRAFT_1122658 [Armillaria mellea]|nr:hypothetical protein F5146DRAFT_1122658 [Armillaria mellea]